LLWSPRLLGVLLGLFVGLFALDALGEGTAAFLVHTLPAVLIWALVAASWRREWLGATFFVLLAVAYGVLAWRAGHPGWLLPISGPLVVVGILFLVSWRHHAELHAENV
jgi:hypothetical protein